MKGPTTLESGLANSLHRAARECREIDCFAAEHDIGLVEAYQIQRQLIDLRVAEGETIAGAKLGFTSRSKMRQMGVSDTIWGQLTNQMRIADGGELSLAKFIHPKVEPEVAFLLKRDVAGPISALEAIAAVDGIAPAIEVIDSRFRDFRFTLCDVVADNCSSSAFVIGEWSKVQDVSNLGVLFEVDGRSVRIGSTAAILGDPARALTVAARLAGQAGRILPRGSIVLAGAATDAIGVAAGMRISATIQRLGRVSLGIAG